MIAFIGTFLQLHPIIIAHHQWLSKTRSIPYWTMSVFSSYSDWLGSDLRIGRFFSFHIVTCLRFWDFPFSRLLRLAGSRWRYSTPPPHGFYHWLWICFTVDNSWARTTSKTPMCYCYMRVRFSGNVLTEPVPRNGRLCIRLLHNNGCTRCCLATGLHATVLLVELLSLGSKWITLRKILNKCEV
jgi:hypothetical protein